MIQKILNAFFGSQHERDLKQLLPVLHRINAPRILGHGDWKTVSLPVRRRRSKTD